MSIVLESMLRILHQQGLAQRQAGEQVYRFQLGKG